MRASLDEEHEGERRRWVLLMMPLAPMVPALGDPAAGAVGSKLLMGGIAVKTGTKVAALVAVVIALLAGTRYAGLWGKGKGTRDGAAVAAKQDGGGGPVTPVTPVASESSAPASRVPVFRDDDPRGTLRLEGVVLDEAEKGVAGARVAIDAAPPMIVETDSDGSFVFQGLIARDYRVEATSGDSYAGPARLRLTAKTEPVTLRLRKGGVVEVVVTDRAGGGPVAGAQVELRRGPAVERRHRRRRHRHAARGGPDVGAAGGERQGLRAGGGDGVDGRRPRDPVAGRGRARPRRRGVGPRRR